MIKHFIITALRNILKRRLLSFVQILGLSLGIAVFILIAKYVYYETSWDKSNEKFDRIYRVQSYKKKDKNDINTNSAAPVSSYITQNIPEVETAITLDDAQEFFSSSEGKTFFEINGYYAPSDIFKIFNYELIEGDEDHILDNPDAIVISESMAKKYFPGKRDIVGRIILNNQKKPLTITGIMKDVPENTNIRPNFLRSITDKRINEGSWGNNSFQNFVLLKPGIKPELVNEQIKDLYDKHQDFNKYSLYLHPLKKLHLEPDDVEAFKIVVFFYSMDGLLILILALINFMNLSVSFSATRASEIGIRKTNGSGKRFIALQFLSESVFISIFSFVFAVILAFIGLPYFNQVVDREIVLSLHNDAGLILSVLLVTVVCGLITGIYPAFVASGFNPVKVLKSKNLWSGKKSQLSGMTAMVLLQFILSSALISSSLWTYKQVDYLQNKELGFNKEFLLHCRIKPNNSEKSYETLKSEILQNPAIKDMTISTSTPFHNSWGDIVFYEDGPADEYSNVRCNRITPDFLNTFNMTLKKGRNFSDDLKSDNRNCMVNETAVRRFGWDNPIGKWIRYGGSRYYIIGVVKDFHQNDVFMPIQPYIFFMHDEDIKRSNNFTFLISPNMYKVASKHIEKIFTETFTNSLFSIYRYDDDSDRKDIQIWSNVKNTFIFFTVLAIIIAVVGIFGLVVFSSQRRIKEIGVRKIQGATIGQVFGLITQKFVVLVILANIIISPVFPILRDNTPGTYKYMATIWDVIMVMGITVLIVFVSSGYLAFKAARSNPVEALRYE